MSCTFACVWDCVGVKPRKLELKRRIEEDTAIVRAVSPPSVFLLKVHPRHLLRDIGGGVFSFLRFFRCLVGKERSASHFRAECDCVRKVRGEGNTMDSQLKQRLSTWGIDMLIISVSIAIISLIIFGITHFFRLFDTGRYIVRVLQCTGSFWGVILWPLLVLLGVIVFRVQIKNALDELPTFIKNYSLANKITSVGGVEKIDEEYENDNEKDKINKWSENKSSSPQRELGKKFEDTVMGALEVELGFQIKRDVLLFDNKMFRYDGAVIRNNRITAIEVVFSEKIVLLERTIDRIVQNYHCIGKQDQDHFDLMLCLPLSMNQHLNKLVSIRQRLPFLIEFRFYPIVKA